MPKNKQNNEPDDELPFPKYSLREIEANPKMAQTTYNSLHRYAKSRNGIIKHLRTENKGLYQENLLLTEKYRALEQNTESKQTTDSLAGFLALIATTVIAVGVTFAFTTQDHIDLGVLLIICGLIIASFTALLPRRSTGKRRGDHK